MKKERPNDAIYEIDDLVIDTGARRISRGTELIHLPRRSYELLLCLVRAAPKVVTSEQFFEEVWTNRIVGHETVTQRIKLVREALGDNPRQPRYVEVIWGEGYRLCAPVRRISKSATIIGKPSRFPKKAPNWLAAIALLVLAAVAGILRLADPMQAGAEYRFEPPANSIAVMPFLNIGGVEKNQFLADGIPDTLLHRLANFEDMLVIARSSSFALRGAGATATDIGRELNVRYLLEGSVQSANDQYKINTKLIETINADHVWSLERRLPVTKLLTVQDEIVTEIGKALELTLREDPHARKANYGTTSVPAYLNYLRGRHATRTLALRKQRSALRYYEQAVAIDPDFARAWLGIAQTYLLLGQGELISSLEMNERVNRYVSRTLELDANLGAAYVLKARALEVSHPRFFSARIVNQELRKEHESLLMEAIRRSPEDPAVLHAYAASICSPMQKDYSCHERKASLLKEVIRRDPENSFAYVDLAWTLIALDITDGPGALYDESVRRNPEFIPGYTNIALRHWGSRYINWTRSIICLCEALERDPDNPFPTGMLASIYIDAGIDTEARRMLDRLESTTAPKFLAAFQRAKMHLYRGEFESAATQVRDHLPEVADGSLGLVAYGAIVESALSRQEFASDIELLENALTTYNVSVEYADGLIRSRSAAFTAVALSELHTANGNETRAAELITGAREFFERENAKNSLWRWPNAWAYAATLLKDGRPEEAITELKTIPKNYLRNSWYLSRAPYFAQIREHPEFQSLIDTIDNRIAEQRRGIMALGNDLPDCVSGVDLTLPTILAIDVGEGPAVENTVALNAGRH